MILFKTIEKIKSFIETEQKNGKTVGFVPTMGALHEGHISLITTSRNQCDITICSIFVNPTQFNNSSDFDKYPITINEDINLLLDARCDVLFLPSVAEMYPNGIEKNKLTDYNLNNLDKILEGEFRPGHFQGVANIVHKLLKAVPCKKLFMGAKDYQQCMVVDQLIKDQKINTELIKCPTLREQNGLAKSSRNMRLSAVGKEKAKVIYECLLYLKSNQNELSFEKCLETCDVMLQNASLEKEYIILANAQNLIKFNEFTRNEKMVILLAAYCEGVRLIDNMEL
jgi:pantoate--beta-alanine ligase